MGRKYNESGGNWYKTAAHCFQYAFNAGVGTLIVLDGDGRWPGTDAIRVQGAFGSAFCGSSMPLMDNSVNSEFYFGFAFRVSPGYVGQLLQFIEGSDQGLAIYINNSQHLIPTAASVINSGLIATSTNIVLPQDNRAIVNYSSWNSLILHVKPCLHTSGSPDGVIEMKLNNALVYSQTNVVTSWLAAFVDGFRFTSFGNGSYIDVCDVWCNDTTGDVSNGWEVDQRLYVTRPAAQGQSTQMTPDPNTNPNWQNVAETDADGATTRNIAATAPLTDLYLPATPPSNLTVVRHVEVIMAAQKDDAGDCQAAIVLGDGTNVVAGDTKAIGGGSYQAYRTQFPKNPFPGSPVAWLANDISTSVNGGTPLQVGGKRVA